MFKTQKKIAVLGGDLRQACLANALIEHKITDSVTCLFLDKEVELSEHINVTNDYKAVLQGTDIVIMGLPISTDNIFLNTPFSNEKLELEEMFRYINKDAFVLGGISCEDIDDIALKYGIEVNDYFKREELAVLNAVPTAEGALEIAMKEMPTTIFGSKCMVIGYGRIGKAIARILIACGADVTVAARSYEDLANAKINGCNTVLLTDFERYLGDMDVLFNTVPAMIMNEICLRKTKKSCLIIDVASKPGGVDFDIAKQLGLNVVWALSLPGKVAPISAGEIILDTIINMMSEKGIYI